MPEDRFGLIYLGKLIFAPLKKGAILIYALERSAYTRYNLYITRNII